MQAESPRVLILGSRSPRSHTSPVAASFRRAGCDVEIFERAQIPQSLHRGRLNFCADIVSNFSFLKAVRDFRPGIVFTEKSPFLYPVSLRRAKEKWGFRYVQWYGDNPFCHQVTSFHVLKTMPLTDLFCSWGEFLIEPLLAAGCPRVIHLPFAYAPDHHPWDVELTEEERARHRSDVVFVGSWDREREAVLERLKDFDLKICGQAWEENLAANSGLRRFLDPQPVWGRAVAVRFKAAKIVLNIFRKFNLPSHNFRTMEACGVGGGALLTEKTREQARLYEEGRHYFSYREASELPGLVSGLLKDPARLEEASRSAHEHTMKCHLLDRRIETILQAVKR